MKTSWLTLLLVLAVGLLLGLSIRDGSTAQAEGSISSSGVKWARSYPNLNVELGYKEDGSVVWRRH